METAVAHIPTEHRWQEAVVDYSPMGIVLLDDEARLKALNPAACLMLGLSERDLTGQLIWGFVPPSVRRVLTRLWPRWIEIGRQEDFEVPFVRSDEERIFECRCIPGIVERRHVVILVDVTSRIEVERALRSREQHLREVIENSTDILSILDADGRPLYRSPALAHTLGFKPAEFEGVSGYDVVTPGDREKLERVLREVASKPGARICEEFRLRHRDGGIRHVETVFTNLLEGPIRGIVINGRDITSRRQLERRLHLSQKLEAVGRLAGGIAHDFNNLLTVIKAASEFLASDISEDDPRQVDVTEIKKAAERASGLTRQLLAFSRRQVLCPERLNLNSVVAEMGTMLKRIIGEDIEISTDLASDLRLVIADPLQIEQVIVNLAVNSRDAMPDGGRLEIKTQNIDLDENDSGDGFQILPGAYVMLSISDNGKGMSSETSDKVFEPFFTTGNGVGLGLATVYGIVKQSDGYIFVDSEQEEGTSFSIYLPEARPAGDDVTDAPATEYTSASAGIDSDREGQEEVDTTILLVEDDSTVRSVTRRILEKNGFKVLEADGGDNALRLTDEYPGRIDLLLTDVVMPKMSGRTVADKVGEKRPGTRVLFFSGYTDDLIVQKGVLKPGLNFLEKPFTSEKLLAKVRDLVEPSSARVN